MATATVSHSVLGMKNLTGVSGPQLAPAQFNKRDRSAKVTAFDSSARAIRARSGKSCSSSHSHRGLGFSQSSSAAAIVPVKSGSRRVVIGSAVRSSLPPLSPSVGGDEFVSGRVSFPPSSSPTAATEGVQFLDIDQSSMGRNSGSAINSLPEDQVNSAESLHDAVLSLLESDPTGEMLARPQPIVQGFADSPFVGEFAMDLSVGAGSSEFESLSSVSGVPVYRPKWIWFATSPEEENMIIDRTINATIVGSAGILAVTKMLTVDHDYWHGWTLVEILKYAPVHNWFAYEELLKTHPILAKMMISGTVYAIGDWIAQCYEGKPALEFNRLRMFRSGLVGFCLHGSMSHFYYQFSEWLFPFQSWWVVPLKVAFDQTLWAALWNSLYFTTIGVLRLESPATVWKELRETFVPLITAGWKLWPFAHLITYGLVPVEQRLLWVDMVEIVWVCILAMYSNEKSEARIAEAESSEETKGALIEDVANAVSVDEVIADEKLS